ncbi:MAG: hypothetical protein HYU37_20785 [Acidobacteria bacterium]|nr:hypothetical protein [Acidobacteriota bacterium]
MHLASHEVVNLGAIVLVVGQALVHVRALQLGEAADLVDGFVAKKLLESGRPAPTFGHDTRHHAARAWLAANELRGLLSSEANALVHRTAEMFHGVDEVSGRFVVALLVLSEQSELLGLSPAARALVNAPSYLFEEAEAKDLSALDGGLRDSSRFGPGGRRLVAVALNNRGVTKRQRGDVEGELADYTAIVEMADAPAQQRATALHNRGVAKGQREDVEGALADFVALRDLSDVPEKIKQEVIEILTRLGAS